VPASPLGRAVMHRFAHRIDLLPAVTGVPGRPA
jgi:hypothetical protein